MQKKQKKNKEQIKSDDYPTFLFIPYSLFLQTKVTANISVYN